MKSLVNIENLSDDALRERLAKIRGDRKATYTPHRKTKSTGIPNFLKDISDETAARVLAELSKLIEMPEDDKEVEG